MKELYKALAAFQQECPVIIKDSSAHAYKYADLPSILEKVNPLLKKHGLGFTQMPNHEALKTVVFHIETGQSIEADTPLRYDIELKGMNAFQVFGSQLTYNRRYALSSMLGIITDVDNDAQGEQTSKPSFQPRRTVVKEEKPWLNPGTPQWDNALGALKGGKMIIDILDHYKISAANREKLMAEAL